METREIIERLNLILRPENGDVYDGATCRIKIREIVEELEEEDFRDEVYGQFGWSIERNSAFAPDLIAAAREGRRLEFIFNARYVADEQWIEDNFEKIGKIMELVCELADAKEATDAADVKEKE